VIAASGPSGDRGRFDELPPINHGAYPATEHPGVRKMADMKDTIRLPGISVFLPAHNEEGNIERVVRGFIAELPKVADNYEIIVVDDGSRDRTGAIADQMAASDPHVKVVHHQVNRGYGGAVISGIAAASQPFVLLCDGDGQFDPADVELLAARMRDWDVAVGRRIRRADHLMRRVNGKAWTVLVGMLFGLHVSDMDCGFKLFRRDLLDGIELHSNGAMITTELMARLAGRGARICEVDVKHLPRLSGEQSGNNLRVVAKAFRDLFVLYRDLKSARAAEAARESRG
jgi:glycosyltransferase involved in cell wall biosynthesis